MREFFNPFTIIKSLFAKPQVAARKAAESSVGQEEAVKKPKKTRGISSQRSTLLTAGSAIGQDTKRKTLLGAS